MNVAVSLGAKEGDAFVSYVSFLADKGYVPPNGKHWVDHIRTKSNEANHEIALMSKEEAERLLTFVEMMLKFIYETTKCCSRTCTPVGDQPLKKDTCAGHQQCSLLAA